MSNVEQQTIFPQDQTFDAGGSPARKTRQPISGRLKLAKHRMRALCHALSLDPDDCLADAIEAWLESTAKKLGAE